jgi:hypothetical protein
MRARNGNTLNLLLLVAGAIAIGGLAFAVGRTTAPASSVLTGQFPGGQLILPDGSFDPGTTGNVQGGGPFGRGGPTISGKVASIDADSITLTLDSGDTMTVNLDGSTTYHTATDATQADVAVGDDVSVRVDGGRFQVGGGATSSAAPSVTASDVTVDP